MMWGREQERGRCERTEKERNDTTDLAYTLTHTRTHIHVHLYIYSQTFLRGFTGVEYGGRDGERVHRA